MQMTFRSYADIARSTQKETSKSLEYLIPGYVAEAGELAGNHAKFVRDGVKTVYDTEVLRKKQLKELGDGLWFIAMLAEQYGSSLEEVARMNNDKLLARQTAGTIGGSGDER